MTLLEYGAQTKGQTHVVYCDLQQALHHWYQTLQMAMGHLVLVLTSYSETDVPLYGQYVLALPCKTAETLCAYDLSALTSGRPDWAMAIVLLACDK